MKKLKKSQKEEVKKINPFEQKYSRYIGIDPGTTITGLSILSGSDAQIETFKPPFKEPLERLIYLGDIINEKIKSTPQALIAIEKPFGIQGHARILLELLGIFKYNLKKQGHILIEIPQKSLKVFATGKGDAAKSDMVLRAYKEFGIDNAGEDGVDAFWLSKFAEAVIVGSVIDFRRKAIDNFFKK